MTLQKENKALRKLVRLLAARLKKRSIEIVDLQVKNNRGVFPVWVGIVLVFGAVMLLIETGKNR